MSTKRFKLDGEVYEMASQADVTLRDFILLEQETTDLGRRFTMGEIVRLGEKFQELTPEESRHDEDGAWMLSATIWMAMVRKKRQAGDLSQVKFADAIDSNLATFEILPDPQDKQAPGKPKKRPSGSARPGAKKAGAAKRSSRA
jgi:hypothetical protein